MTITLIRKSAYTRCDIRAYFRVTTVAPMERLEAFNGFLLELPDTTGFIVPSPT